MCPSWFLKGIEFTSDVFFEGAKNKGKSKHGWIEDSKGQSQPSKGAAACLILYKVTF